MSAVHRIAKYKTLSYLFAISVPLLFSTVCFAQVTVIEAPGNYQFIDMGYNAVNDEVIIVGHVFENNQEVPTIFEPNTNQDGFNTETLSNLANATIEATVTGISPDGSRIAGFSNSPITCLLYTSPSPRDKRQSRMPSSA